MENQRRRLNFLDGIRGLAALFVVAHHIYYSLCLEIKLSPALSHATYWLYLGRCAVDVFIVLSGYCLMLPVAGNSTGQLRGGTVRFFKRRATRILPPYYAALVLCFLLAALLPLRHLSYSLWTGVYPLVDVGSITSHILLIHNLNPAWAHRIDYPMWSVATEWQIYFLFPFLLLPIWRKFGTLVLVAVGFLVGFGLIWLFPQGLSEASPHYLGLFAFGMAAAVISAHKSSASSSWLGKLPWGTLAFGLLLAVGVPSVIHLKKLVLSVPVKDVIVGASTACLLIYLASVQPSDTKRLPIVMRLLESRPVVILGTFSYSLYLMHAPVIALVQSGLRTIGLTPGIHLLVYEVIGITLALAVAYLFHLVFERPFMPGHPHTEKQAATAAALSPAP